MECNYSSVFSQTDRCQFVHENCDFSYFSFLALHYCSFDEKLYFSLPVAIALAALAFYMLSTTANKYTSDSSQMIADTLKLSPAIAGITILALGNGAPDVISMIVAMDSVSGFELSLGSVIGSTMFLGSFVMSCVIINAGVLTIDRSTFIRHVSVLLLAIIFISANTLIFKELNFLNVLVFVFIFVVYLTYFIVSDIRRSKKEALSIDSDDKKQSHVDELESIEEGNESILSGIGDNNITIHTNMETESDKVVEMKSMNNVVEICYFNEVADMITNEIIECNEQQSPVTKSEYIKERRPTKLSYASHKSLEDVITHRFNSRFLAAGMNSLHIRIKNKFNKENVYIENDNDPQENHLIRISLISGNDQEIKGKSVATRIYTSFSHYVLDIPFTFLRNISIPPYQQESYKFWRFILLPLGIALLIIGVFRLDKYFSNWIVAVSTILVVLAITLMIWIKADKKSIPSYPLFLSILSFIFGIVWIYFAANILIEVIQAVGLILNLPDAFLSVTFIAIGNCLPDFSLNISLAKKNLGNLAIYGTLLSSIFNLGVGMGLSMLKYLITHGTLYVKLETFSIIACAITVGNLLRLIIQGFIENFQFTKKGSYIGICIYVLFVACLITLVSLPDK